MSHAFTTPPTNTAIKCGNDEVDPVLVTEDQDNRSDG